MILVATLAATTVLAGTKVQGIYSTADLSVGQASAPVPEVVARPFARPDVVIDPSVRHQEILGFGGTFTENSANNLLRLSPRKRADVIRQFFGRKDGANWNLIRISIGSCDASTRHYTFNEADGDREMKQFDIQPDVDNFMIPALKMALREQPRLRIQASPWTAPRWMKDSKAHNHGKLLLANYGAWALYFDRFLTAYRKHGVPIWSITPQNEPDAHRQAWDAMGWSDEALGTFVNKHLAPLVRRNHPEVRIFGWDHNKNNMERWAKANLENPARRGDYDGIVYHWYEGGEGKMYEPVARLHARYPDLPLLPNEQGLFGTFLMQPQAAELYAVDLLENLNHGASGWIVWGTFFDHMGGPNHANNPSHSPIMVFHPENRLIVNPSYHYIAQVSRWVLPEARRVGLTDRSGLLSSAFVNPDGGKVWVVLNRTGERKLVKVNAGDVAFSVELPPRSMSTYRW